MCCISFRKVHNKICYDLLMVFYLLQALNSQNWENIEIAYENATTL